MSRCTEVLGLALLIVASLAYAQISTGFGDPAVSGGLSAPGGGSSGPRGTIVAHTANADGGADNLMVRVAGDFGLPVTLGVDYRVARAAGVHPTEYVDWTEVIDEDGQAEAQEQEQVADIEHFTARGDVIGVRWRVYVGGSLAFTDSATTTSGADYWRWWNYAYVAAVTVDDGLWRTAVSVDSLGAALGKRFTLYVNPVHAIAYGDTVEPISAAARAYPNQLAALTSSEIGNHALTHASLYNSQVRGSLNDGGLMSAADTVGADAAGNWSDLGMPAIYAPEPTQVGTGLVAFFKQDDSAIYSGNGINYDSDDGSWQYTGMTFTEHLMAEIERDSLETFGIVASAASVKTFAYPNYSHNAALVSLLDAEGYLGARGSYDNAGDPWGDLTSAPENRWERVSVYRVPTLCKLFTHLVLDHLVNEATFKARVDSITTEEKCATRGGIYPIITHSVHVAEADAGYSGNYITPEELEWFVEAVEADSGLVVGMDVALAYYRDRAEKKYLTDEGDIVFATSEWINTQVAVAALSFDERITTQNDPGWPIERDLEITNVAWTLYGPSIDDSTSHITHSADLFLNADDRWGGAPERYFPDHGRLWFDLSGIPAGAVIDSCVLWLRPNNIGTHELYLAEGDTLYLAWSHVAGDLAWLDNLGAGANADHEANSSWLLQDIADAESAWDPPMTERFADRSWATWNYYPGPRSDGQGYWQRFDVTTGARLVHAGSPNGGLHFFIRDANTATREFVRIPHWDSSANSTTVPWVGIWYHIPLSEI